MNGAKIIGLMLLITLSLNTNVTAQNLWSKKIMNCKNSECSIDEITWESNQAHKTYEGHLIDETKHYCKKPEYWLPIVNSLIRQDGFHNNMLLRQIVAEKCYEVAFPKKVVLFEKVLNGKNWYIRRAQWLYDQPEEIYQAFVK